MSLCCVKISELKLSQIPRKPRYVFYVFRINTSDHFATFAGKVTTPKLLGLKFKFLPYSVHLGRLYVVLKFQSWNFHRFRENPVTFLCIWWQILVTNLSRQTSSPCTITLNGWIFIVFGSFLVCRHEIGPFRWWRMCLAPIAILGALMSNWSTFSTNLGSPRPGDVKNTWKKISTK